MDYVGLVENVDSARLARLAWWSAWLVGLVRLRGGSCAQLTVDGVERREPPAELSSISIVNLFPCRPEGSDVVVRWVQEHSRLSSHRARSRRNVCNVHRASRKCPTLTFAPHERCELALVHRLIRCHLRWWVVWVWSTGVSSHFWRFGHPTSWVCAAVTVGGGGWRRR